MPEGLYITDVVTDLYPGSHNLKRIVSLRLLFIGNVRGGRLAIYLSFYISFVIYVYEYVAFHS